MLVYVAQFTIVHNPNFKLQTHKKLAHFKTTRLRSIPHRHVAERAAAQFVFIHILNSKFLSREIIVYEKNPKRLRYFQHSSSSCG